MELNTTVFEEQYEGGGSSRVTKGGGEAMTERILEEYQRQKALLWEEFWRQEIPLWEKCWHQGIPSGKEYQGQRALLLEEFWHQEAILLARLCEEAEEEKPC